MFFVPEHDVTTKTVHQGTITNNNETNNKQQFNCSLYHTMGSFCCWSIGVLLALLVRIPFSVCRRCFYRNHIGTNLPSLLVGRLPGVTDEGGMMIQLRMVAVDERAFRLKVKGRGKRMRICFVRSSNDDGHGVINDVTQSIQQKSRHAAHDWSSCTRDCRAAA
jgi:hypothetical protein